jgi:hypothetical protein
MGDPKSDERQCLNGITQKTDSDRMGTTLISKAREADALKTVLASVVRDELQLQIGYRRLGGPRTSYDGLELKVQRLVRLLPVVRVSLWHDFLT